MKNKKDIKKEKNGTLILNKPHYFGHRERMRKKLAAGASGLSDYELLEVLLFYIFSRKDTKELAKRLLAHFGSLRKLVFSKNINLSEVKGIGKSCSTLFSVIREIIFRAQLGEIKDSVVIASSSQVIDYYKNIFFDLTNEQLRIMFLNNKNILLAEELFHEGTINQTAIYPRTIIKRALELGAAAIIIVHNHPSGDPEPSRQDIIITRNLQEISQQLDILLLDHLIVGKNEIFSMKAHSII